MKLRHIAVAAVASSALFASTSAQALTVNFSGSNVNMGNVQVGQNGTITNILSVLPNHKYQSIVSGNLPHNSEIIFTYSFPVDYIAGSLDANIAYNYNHNGNHYNGSSEGKSQTDIFDNTTTTVFNQGFKNSIAGVSQVFATAFISTPGNNSATGKTTFANYTTGFQAFTSQFLGIFCGCRPETGTITYTVSSIPLPASLPAMLLAVGGLFGMTRMRKRQLAA